MAGNGAVCAESSCPGAKPNRITLVMPGWLRVIARVNPLTYEVQGLRQMLVGVGGAGEVAGDGSDLPGGHRREHGGGPLPEQRCHLVGPVEVVTDVRAGQEVVEVAELRVSGRRPSSARRVGLSSRE